MSLVNKTRASGQRVSFYQGFSALLTVFIWEFLDFLTFKSWFLPKQLPSHKKYSWLTFPLKGNRDTTSGTVFCFSASKQKSCGGK